MKYYIILAITQGGNSCGTFKAKNKCEAIKEARKNCKAEIYVPVLVKRISKKYFDFIFNINQAGGNL